MHADGKISPTDLDLVHVTDDVDEAVEVVRHRQAPARLEEERAALAARVVAERRAAGGPTGDRR